METVPIGAFDAATGARDVFLDIELQRGSLRRNLRMALREAIQQGRLAPTRTTSSQPRATSPSRRGKRRWWSRSPRPPR